MQGLALAEAYFWEQGLPALTEQCPAAAERAAAGLVGDGSDCFGFDDELSRDHDWGPGFCLWLRAADLQRFGAAVERALEQLPGTFSGFPARQTSAWGAGRVGVLEVEGFYAGFTGLRRPPETLLEWLALPEASLATATNGRVFRDPLGAFSAWRAQLLEFYPEDVRLKKLAARCMALAQAGQYNYPRCVQRGDWYAAQYAETKFCSDLLSLIFLLNRVYAPYYKWQHRAVAELPLLGPQVHRGVREVVGAPRGEATSGHIEALCRVVADWLRAEGLSAASGNCLLDHGPELQARIRDPELRRCDVWVG